MESLKSSGLDSARSKKQVVGSPDPKVREKAPALDPNPWSVKTPAKPVDLPCRLRNRNLLLSIKEIRQAAIKLPEPVPEPPARPEPATSSAGSPASKKSKRKNKSNNADVQLPEKYELLAEFFNSLDSSIRLLRLKRSIPTFTHISPQIERLTDRRFTYSHLAQLKFIMPEAIELKKVLVHDESTSCMKPNLHITLNIEVVRGEKKSKSDTRNLQLRKAFRARLFDFVKSHPESDEVPEEVLPEPFNRLQKDIKTISVRSSASSSMIQTPATELAQKHPPAAASHLSPAFRSSFSCRGSTRYAESLEPEHSCVSIPPPPVSEPKLSESPCGKKSSTFAASSPSKLYEDLLKGAKCSANVPFSTNLSPSPLLETPVKSIISAKDNGSTSSESTILRTPKELVYSPAEWMNTTPVREPPKRTYMSPNDDSFRSPSKLVRRGAPRRSLLLDTPVKGPKVEDELGEIGKSSLDHDIFDTTLIQSIREKERKISMEQDPAISQAKWRRQMIASLPEFFDTVYFFFQSIKRSVVTKDELMHKVIADRLAVADKREVEEQLRLLQELVPEWIHEKLASGGDLIICVVIIQASGMRQRQLVDFRTPQHPYLGTNNWGGASPLLARNIPEESLEQRYQQLHTIRDDEIYQKTTIEDEIYSSRETNTTIGQEIFNMSKTNGGEMLKCRPTPRRGGLLWKMKVSRNWFRKWNAPKKRWPNGWC